MRNILIPAFALLAMGCGKEKELPKEAAQPAKPPRVETPVVTESANTFFSATPLEALPKDKNALYGASMLLAWQEVKGLFNEPITVGSRYKLLHNLNSTDLYKNTLKKGEYITQIEQQGDIFKISAKFDKKLPFTYPLDSFKNGLEFAGQKVDAFGTKTLAYDHELTLDILYYKSDDDFILRLDPDDQNHEIILCMLPEKGKTLKDMFDVVLNKTATGKEEMRQKATMWRYYLNERENDEVVIPKINFNLKTEYEQLKDNVFSAGKYNSHIVSALQQTVFKLDEAGAEVLDEADLAVPAATFIPGEEEHPKKMHFNKPFFILLKRADSNNPYFALWVENAELLVKGKP